MRACRAGSRSGVRLSLPRYTIRSGTLDREGEHEVSCAARVVTTLFVRFLGSCAVEEEKPSEKTEERKRVEEVESLSVGEKAELYGMNISVDKA